MEKIREHIKNISESKILVRILYLLAILIVAKIIFFAGIVVGFHKASYGDSWSKHYEENFGIGHRELRMGSMSKGGMMGYYPNANGATGKIIKIELPNIIVADKDNTEKTILVSNNTIIQKQREKVLPTDLKVDDFIVTIGTPNGQGQIEAKLIRVIPAPNFLNQP